MNELLKIFLVFLGMFIAVGYSSSLITEYTGVGDPTVPVIGALPIISAGLAVVLYKYWLKKEI